MQTLWTSLSLDHQAQNVVLTTMCVVCLSVSLGKESHTVKKAKFVTSCYASKLFHAVCVSDRKRTDLCAN